MLALGSQAPNFKLWEPGGAQVELAQFRNAPSLLVMFICNHCPYIKYVRHELANLAKEYRNRSVLLRHH